MVLVSLTAATICFNGMCAPALIGKDTPTGIYQLRNIQTHAPGYNGDILLFHETKDYWFAIHRVYTLNPKQRRIERLRSENPKDRLITMGCINVMPDVYEQLVKCCADEQVNIHR